MSVVFYGCVTMDGYIAGKNHDLDLLYQTVSIEETGYEDFYKSINITIMGKRTFDVIKNIDDISSVYPTTKNYVFTHAESLPVSGFIPVNCNVVEFVKQLQTDQNIWIIGGNTILAPLIDNDMVDNIDNTGCSCFIGSRNTVIFTKRSIEAFLLERSKKVWTVCRIMVQ